MGCTRERAHKKFQRQNTPSALQAGARDSKQPDGNGGVDPGGNSSARWGFGGRDRRTCRLPVARVGGSRCARMRRLSLQAPAGTEVDSRGPGQSRGRADFNISTKRENGHPYGP